MSRRARAAALLAALLAAEPALAEPSRWDRIRDPQGARAEQALTVALRARTPSDVPIEVLPAFDALLALRAATLLEMAGGAELGTPDVWFFLGDALVVADKGRDEEGRQLLYRALAAVPDSPQAAHAWYTVGIASDRLRDFEAERRAYGEALRLQWDRDLRAGIHLNRGEASMSLHELRAAEADYRDALANTSDSEIHALAAWGLAVALARDDDLPDALRYAFEAQNFHFRGPDGGLVTALDLPSVFFTPAYEESYYRALGAMAVADRSTKVEERRAAFERAIEFWGRYLEPARREHDFWAENAEQQKRYCERRLHDKRR